jgi:hypothetical protein
MKKKKKTANHYGKKQEIQEVNRLFLLQGSVPQQQCYTWIIERL